MQTTRVCRQALMDVFLVSICTFYVFIFSGVCVCMCVHASSIEVRASLPADVLTCACKQHVCWCLCKHIHKHQQVCLSSLLLLLLPPLLLLLFLLLRFPRKMFSGLPARCQPSKVRTALEDAACPRDPSHQEQVYRGYPNPLH